MLEWGGTLVQIARDPQTNSEVTGGRGEGRGGGGALPETTRVEGSYNVRKVRNKTT